MSKVVIALLIIVILVIILLLFCIVVLPLAPLIFARRGKEGGKRQRLLSIGKLDFWGKLKYIRY